MKNHLNGIGMRVVIGLLLASAWPLVSVSAASVDASAPVAIRANDAHFRHFLDRHATILRRDRERPVGLVFLGDSITEGWQSVPVLWQNYYGQYLPANFGVDGDTTQGVIWRIEHGEFDGIRPRVVVLLLGTNNTATHSAAEIAAADRKIVEMIRIRLPETKVLVLAIFPRGPRTSAKGKFDDGVSKMQVIREINPELAKLDDGIHVRFLDIGSRFLGPDGNIPDAIMADHLHPTAAGYRIWAAAMQPMLRNMMR